MKPAELKGGRIVEVFEVGEEVILVVEKGNRVYQVEPWSDEEGNGSGYLDVSVIEGAVPGRPVRLAGAEEGKAG